MNAILDPSGPNMLGDLAAVFGKVLAAAIPFAAVAVFIMLVVGGYMYTTSGSNPQRAEMARNTLTFAIVGLVLIALSFMIIVIISNFTGVDTILDFTVVVPN